jgi:hypothetical protein
LNARLLVLVTALAGCASTPPGPRALLDTRTGASITVVDSPLVFARERRDAAAHARDYLTIVAAEINETGQRRLVLAVHRWSTIDQRSPGPRPGGSELILIADGRDFRFAPLQGELVDRHASNRQLRPPDDAHVITTFYETDAATLEYLGASDYLSASYSDGFALPFALWRDGRAALRRMAALVSSGESP